MQPLALSDGPQAREKGETVEDEACQGRGECQRWRPSGCRSSQLELPSDAGRDSEPKRLAIIALYSRPKVLRTLFPVQAVSVYKVSLTK